MIAYRLKGEQRWRSIPLEGKTNLVLQGLADLVAQNKAEVIILSAEASPDLQRWMQSLGIKT